MSRPHDANWGHAHAPRKRSIPIEIPPSPATKRALREMDECETIEEWAALCRRSEAAGDVFTGALEDRTI